MDRTKVAATRWPAWLNAAGLLLASFVVMASISLQARAGADVVAVAFPPWWDSHRVFSAAASANAAIVRTTAVPSLLVVRPDGDGGLSRLKQVGAWFTIDPQAIAACFKIDARSS